MTDPWARPTDDGAPAQRRPVDAFEIELDGPDNLPVGGSNDAPDDEPNWRKVAGIASISGVLLGVVVSALVFWNDGRDDAPATTTVPRDELAAEITTPPTLPPVETTPTTTVPTPGRPELATRDITVPSYPAPDDPGAPWPDAPTRFPTLNESLTVEVVTDNLYGDEPTATSVRYDAVNGRYEISSRLPVGTATMIYDSSTDSIYEGIIRPRSGIDTIWTRRPGSDWFAGESTTATEYFGQAVLGPVRNDNVGFATSIERDGVTRTVLGVPARATRYEIPESAVGLWGDAEGDGSLEFDVYADEHGEVVRIQGVSSLRGSPNAIVYTPVVGEVTIQLPLEEDVVDEGVGDQNVLPTGATPESLRPRYETLDPLPAASSDDYSIAAALEHLEEIPPAAASVEVLWEGNAIRMAVWRDDVNDRRWMTVATDTTPGVTIQLDDAASASSLITDDVDGQWTRLSSTGQGGRRAPVDERLISGVLDRSTIASSPVVSSYRWVALRDGTIALEVPLQVDATRFSLPSIVPMPLDPDRPVDVYVYVGAGVIHEIQVLSNTDARILVQRFDLMARPEIELPDPARITDG